MRGLLVSSGAICALLSLSSTVIGQQPYGDPTPGTGGHAPMLTSGKPRIGFAAFGLELHRAAPTSPAVLLLAALSNRVPIFGIDLLVDPATTLVAVPATTSGGMAGEGRVLWPLPVPAAPAIVGARLHAQSIVIDPAAPQALAATRGLRLDIGGEPRVFVACSILSSDPFQLVDPVGGTVLDSGSVPQTDNVNDAAFDAAGNRVFTVSSIRGTINVGDVSTVPTAWSTIWTSPSGNAYGLHADRRREVVWTLSAVTGTGSRELVAVDVATGSPTHGTPRYHTTGMLSGMAEIFDMAPSGDVAAVLTYLPNTLTIVDTDPASPTFLQNVVSQVPVPVDQASVLSLATAVALTPDERYALVTIQGAGPVAAEIARFDIQTRAWVDHNGPGFGTNIGPYSQPQLPLGSSPTSLEIASHGRFAILGGIGSCGWLGRLDLNPDDPLQFGFVAFQPVLPLQNAWTAALSSDETEVAVGTWPRSSCAGASAPELVRFDVATGAQIGTVPIPPNGNGSNQNLYTIVYR